ncbi:MAG: amino acid permease [Acidobacteria bacterium]|nr:MAG: amino acid permease [Acidobacteriota bacterium]
MAAEKGGLRRILGVGFGLAVIVGSTLGIGILRTPGLVAAQLASRSGILAVWLLGGLYTLLGSVCLTELGTMLPRAGGYYVYARRAFGDTAGFAVGWSDWITYCAVLGYVTIAMGEFSAVLAPSLGPAIKPIAVAVLGLFALLQWAGVRISSRFQEATTAVKFLAFLALVAACFAHAAASPSPEGGPAVLRPDGPGFVGLVVALQSVAITYGGWQSALYFTEEDRDPRRNLPRSMIGGVLSVLVIYLLVNLALLSVLPVGALSRSTLPAADAAKAIFGGRGGQMITLLSLVSLPPLVNAIMMIGTRILFAMGRDGLLWRGAAAVNDRGTPVRATLVTTAVAAVLIGTGTFQKLVAVAAFFLAVNYCVCCLALIVLRRREPRLERPFRAWGYHWSAGIVLIGAAAFLTGVLLGDTRTALVAMGLLAAGLLGRLWSSRR